jgi:cellulose synthase/poly-beta-1,6-N-acetylglucosamine synthase-like glycosyltransferase
MGGIEPVVEALPLVFSNDGFMSPVDWIYFTLWLLVDTLNALMSINICRSIFKRHALTAERRKWQDSLAYEPVAVVVPCYLPNEKAIIHSTIDHICDSVEYPADVTLHLVYNSDRRLPQEEARLAALHGQVHGRLKRTVFVHHVEGSRSKAENLNHVIGSVLSEAEARYVAIFDADHHPDPACLRTLMAFMLQQEADCVQGSTYIRNSSWASHAGRGGGYGVVGRLAAWLMANFIDAEFFVTYFVWMPAIELIGRTGFFGGSVALWRYHSLINYTFSTEMQTEDIECSVRARQRGGEGVRAGRARRPSLRAGTRDWRAHTARARRLCVAAGARGARPPEDPLLPRRAIRRALSGEPRVLLAATLSLGDGLGPGLDQIL